MRFLLYLTILASLVTFGGCSTIQCDVINPPPPLVKFPQPLDHSNPDLGTFNQRVQTIDKYYQEGGPILFYAGPENAANEWTLLCLNIMEWAKNMSAVVIGAEHRYFGESNPDKSAGWDYLKLDNILEDYAVIIRNATGSGRRFEGAKTIVFGGSYGGFLSMMMRVKYPGLVAGSIASAAPILLYGGPVDITGLWFDTLTDIYRTHDHNCSVNLSDAFLNVTTQLDAGQYEALSRKLNLCRDPSSITQMEFLIYLQHAFSIIAQFQYPFKAADKVPFPFTDVCHVFRTTDAISAMRHAMDIAYNNTGEITCYWPPPRDEGHGMTDINFALSWTFICCSYFVMPIAGGEKATEFFHFDHAYSFEGYSSYCQSAFGVTPDKVPPFHPSQLEKASNIVFSNMGFDPVHAFSLTDQHVGPSISTLFINDVGHTQDIIAPCDGDEPDVIAARQIELETMQGWVKT